MSSYKASAEFDFTQESSDSDLLESAEVIVEYYPESVILRYQTQSTQNQKVFPWMSHWKTRSGSPNAAEKYKKPHRVKGMPDN